VSKSRGSFKEKSMARKATLEEKKFIEIKAEEGWTSRQIAEELKLSIKTVRKWRQYIKKMASRSLKWVDLGLEPLAAMNRS
jgi:DNA-binding NarL/FixJ family response regulator